MSQRVIGLDLGSYSIKMLEVSRNANGLVFEGAYEARIPLDPKVPREEAQSIVLNEQFGRFGLDKKTVICAIPGHQTSVRLLLFPFSDRKKLEKMIPYEIESQSLLDLDEVVHDWEIATQPPSPEDTNYRILTLSVLKTTFQNYFGALEKASVDPRDITNDALSLAFLNASSPKAFDNPPQIIPGGNCVGLVDCGHLKTNVCILYEGYPIFCRTISIAGREITRTLEQDFRLSFLEAETLKITDGTLVVRKGPGTSAEAEKISNSISRIVNELAAELRQLVVYCQETFGVTINEFSLFGGTAKLKNLGPYLSTSVNIPFKRANYFMGRGISEVSEDQALTLHTALALAARGVEGKSNRWINFRKGDFRYKQSLAGTQPYVSRVGFLGAVLILLLAVNFVGRSILLRSKQRGLETEIIKNMRLADPSYQYRGAQHALTTLRSGGSGKTGDPLMKIAETKSPLVILNEISQSIPAEIPVTLTDIKIDGKSIRLEAKTKTREAISRMRESLAQNPDFQSVKDEDVTAAPDGLQFAMNISLEGETKEKN